MYIPLNAEDWWTGRRCLWRKKLDNCFGFNAIIIVTISGFLEDGLILIKVEETGELRNVSGHCLIQPANNSMTYATNTLESTK